MSRIDEEINGGAVSIRISPTRDAAKALRSLMVGGVGFFPLGALLSHSSGGRDALPLYVTIIFGSITVGFILVAISNALWIWSGTWELKISEDNVAVRIGLRGREWRYQYSREGLKNVHIKVVRRKGMVSGRRVVASVRNKEVNLSPFVTEKEAIRIFAWTKTCRIE